jgi:hypothetical protein
MPSCCRLSIWYRRAWLLSLLLLLGLTACAVRPRPSVPLPEEDPDLPPRDADRVRLAVLVVFDQLRGDYLTRWQDLFGEGGFRRLGHDGAWFQNCHYPYAVTVTGAGHASIATGCSPMTHGIISNEWYDRRAGEQVYCVGSERYPRVPPAPPPKSGEPKKPKGVSPERLLVPTLADALKEATGGKARVVSLSFKDRSAVLPAGHQPDACYWLDPVTGSFVTSTYYRDQLHPWVRSFNEGHPADAWFGHDWDRLRPDLDYVRYSGPDDVVGEGLGLSQGRTFPHPLTGGLRRAGDKYYTALYNSPFGNDLLLGLVKRAVDAEHLGTNDTTDLLCVSFSCNDPIGHCWGPDSQEVMDVTLRSDLIIKQLLNFLDNRVGRGGYVLALTADHGVCPLPEVSRSQGKGAGRVDPKQLGKKIDAFLDQKFSENPGRARWIAEDPAAWVYLNRDILRKRNLQAGPVAEALASWIKTQPEFQTAYTHDQLLQGVPSDDAIGQAVRRSFHPERAGDVTLVSKPYYLVMPQPTGTTHGTPHPYDTHVPLLVFGRGVQAGVRQDPVTPQAVAAILAHALDVKPPAQAEAPLPENLFTTVAP